MCPQKEILLNSVEPTPSCLTKTLECQPKKERFTLGQQDAAEQHQPGVNHTSATPRTSSQETPKCSKFESCHLKELTLTAAAMTWQGEKKSSNHSPAGGCCDALKTTSMHRHPKLPGFAEHDFLKMLKGETVAINILPKHCRYNLVVQCLL
ncbi:Hypothetical predicted protein [Podarcis lilfordi]|uniref:Uncharacterized protein n=1 Tax=Podarcis lilfordi TaxID=74358 RepID=A0AA35K7G6_9SAUR|nr:Hypothetical predicted protein [Podarcis lilfordi]